MTMVPPVAGHQQRDRHVLWAINKLEDKVPAISGLAVLAFGIVGVGTPQAVDNGPQRITFWEFDEGASLTTLAVSIPGALNTLGGGYGVRPSALEVFNPSTVLFAEDVTSGTNFAAVMPSNQGFSLGDWAIQVATFTHGSPGLPGRSFTVPGCTLTGAGGVPLNSTPQNALGNHQYTFTDRGQVTAGAQSAAATAGATTTTPTTGGAAHVRITSYVPLALGNGTETDTAQALALLKSLNLGVAGGSATVPPVALSKALQLGVAGATEVAQALSFAKTMTLGVPTDVSTAPPLALLKALGLGRATETDVARTLTSSKLLTLGRTQETDTALPVAMGVPAVDYTPARTPIASTRAGERTAGTRSVRYTAVTRTVGGSASTREG